MWIKKPKYVYEVIGSSYTDHKREKWESPYERKWFYTVLAEDLTSAINFVNTKEMETELEKDRALGYRESVYFPIAKVIVHNAKLVTEVTLIAE
jgi:predicted N-acyltransferase